MFARESGGLRWYRCLRCDSWIALAPPRSAPQPYPPDRSDVSLPLRGRLLRDRYVLRLIAVDRIVHFLVLSILAAVIFLFATNKAALNAEFTRVLQDLQGGLGGPLVNARQEVVYDLRRFFAISVNNLYLVGVAVSAYAALEAAEAIELWSAASGRST